MHVFWLTLVPVFGTYTFKERDFNSLVSNSENIIILMILTNIYLLPYCLFLIKLSVRTTGTVFKMAVLFQVGRGTIWFMIKWPTTIPVESRDQSRTSGHR